MRRSLVSLGLVAAVAVRLMAHEPEPSRYTFTEDVYPILLRRCGDCHRPGGVAPMSLLDYQQVIPWASSIRAEVLEGRMPPWLPQEGIGQYRGARLLSAEEIDVLADWTLGGTPRGPEADHAAPALDDPAPWPAGEPDRILTPETETVVDADTMHASVCLVLPTGLTEDARVRILDFAPGNPAMVRAASVRLGTTCSRDRRPLLTWLPGDGPYHLPGGAAEKLPAEARLAIEIQYRKTWRDDGRELTDLSRLGLYWAESAPVVEELRVSETRYRLEKGVQLLAFYPDPLDGATTEPVEVAAALPDGHRLSLLRIERFDPNWRRKLVFQQPVDLPAGAVLEVSRPTLWVDFVAAGHPGE